MRFALAIPVVVACRGGDHYVVAPMGAADAGATIETKMADLEGAPREPEPPQPSCAVDTECVPEESKPLVYPPPFERCPPTIGKAPVSSFSAKATLEQRKSEEQACCYVRFDCTRPKPPRPLLEKK